MEAKHRLQTNDENWHQIWKEDGEGRELPYCEIVNTDKETVIEVFRAVNTFDQAREALKHFASNDDWGRVLAWIVGGAPSRQEGIEMARKIVKWQSQAEQSLAAMEATP